MKTALILLAAGHLVMSLPLESPEKAGKAVKAVKAGQSGKNDTEDVCVTRDCINTAYNLFKKMNLTTDPCEDFYEVRNFHTKRY